MKYFRRDVKHQTTNQQEPRVNISLRYSAGGMYLYEPIYLVNNDWRVVMKQHKFTLHFIFFLIQKAIIFFIYGLYLC